MPHPLLSARHEGKDQTGHAVVRAENDMLSPSCSPQAFAARNGLAGKLKALSKALNRYGIQG